MKTLLTFLGGAAVGILAAAAIQTMIDEESNYSDSCNFDSTDNATESETSTEDNSDSGMCGDFGFNLP